MLTSSIPNPIQPIGADVTLNCTVMLNSGPEIDIPLTVKAEVSKSEPDRVSLVTTTVSGPPYSTSAMVSSFASELINVTINGKVY